MKRNPSRDSFPLTRGIKGVLEREEENPSQPPLVRGGENAKLLDLKFIPYDRKLISRARELRINQTTAERIFWRELLNNKERIKYKFSRQKPLDNFIVDFYCSELLLGIEIDGKIHSFSKIRDQERDDILREKYNILIVRYTNEQVMDAIKNVFDNLLYKIKSRVSEFPPDKGD
jgi:very-short-patch-repair endonuclease